MESPHHDESRQNLVPDNEVNPDTRSSICRSSAPQNNKPKSLTRILDGTSIENHLTKANIKLRVIMSMDLAYLKTAPGVLKILLVLLSVVSLITITTSGGNESLNSYLLLPRAIFFRLFVFTAVCGFMTSLLFLFLQVTGLIKLFQFNWHFVDILAYVIFTLLYATSSSLVMANLVSYIHDSDITSWTKEQILLTGVLGYLCSIITGVLAINGYTKYRGSLQFRRFRLQELERLDRLNSLETV